MTNFHFGWTILFRLISQPIREAIDFRKGFFLFLFFYILLCIYSSSLCTDISMFYILVLICFVCVRGSRAEWGPGDHSKADLFSHYPATLSNGDWHTPVILSGTERRERGGKDTLWEGLLKEEEEQHKSPSKTERFSVRHACKFIQRQSPPPSLPLFFGLLEFPVFV